MKAGRKRIARKYGISPEEVSDIYGKILEWGIK